MYYLKFYHVCLISLLLGVADDIIALDPALFLGPSPPLLPSSHTVSPQERWYSVSNRDKPRLIERQASLQSDDELMANAETFWPSLRTAYYGVRAVPLAFSASGNYGKYSDNGPVVATSYISVQSTSGAYRNSGLAGSSYGTYGNDQSGIRIFNGAGKTGWSGWGNGKWGNYGKG